jgi:hypothetical protein
MNLFYNPSLTGVCRLIASPANYHDKYDIIIDHDGEVIIEPSSGKTTRTLGRYKFYFRGLQGKASIGILASKNLRYINQLYKNLMYCWENDLKGVIDYNEITNIQTINYWLEINSIKSSDSRPFVPGAFPGMYDKKAPYLHRGK